MKKFCLVSYCNIYLLPYAKTYIESIEKQGALCTLLFWDRDATGREYNLYPDCKIQCYQYEKTLESSKVKKVNGYVKATSFIRRVLKNEKFDGVVFLQTHAAIACTDILLKYYSEKYVVDIRDYSLENFAWYRHLEEKVISKSFATVISSPAYAKFLPKYDYVIAHNYIPFPEKDISLVRKNNAISKIRPIEISFIGTIRFIENDKKFLNLFKNDFRYKINYFGTGSDVLKQYCVENRICNVEFYGFFSPDQTASFYLKTNIINNLYGNGNHFLDYALSNKLYHAAQFHLPILVCPKTYMEEITREYYMGFTFDINEPNCKDKLFEWYANFDRELLASGCDAFIEKVEKENRRFVDTIERFID